MRHHIRSIVHPTDFSEASRLAFCHALKLALLAKSRLELVHVATKDSSRDWESFPHLRATLVEWGLLEPSDPRAAVGDKLGVKVSKIEVESDNPAAGISQFLERHPSDLVVLATEGRDGLPAWLHRSVAETVARQAMTRTLFLPEGCRGFVGPATGQLHLRRVLVPVDHKPDAKGALEGLLDLLSLVDASGCDLNVLHVGTDVLPAIAGYEVETRKGDPVETILAVAEEHKSDLIMMPTAGRQDLIEMIRGSTTERVVRQAPCPVLAIPAR